MGVNMKYNGKFAQIVFYRGREFVPYRDALKLAQQVARLEKEAMELRSYRAIVRKHKKVIEMVEGGR
jgi:hypothetical protein